MCNQQPQMYRYVLLPKLQQYGRDQARVESDDERDDSDENGGSDAYDDKEDIWFKFLFMTNFIHIRTIFLVFVTDEL